MEHSYLVAALWLFCALTASLISIRVGISVALIEIMVGIVAGNIIHLEITDWVNFLAGFGAVILTFMAGAEIEPRTIKEHFWESMVIGILAFLLPFLVCMAGAYYVFHWDLNASKIAGIALSTTSVAVVYAVMIESGLSSTSLGQAILAACFVNDLGTVLALGLLFTGFTVKLGIFAAILIVVVFISTPLASRIFQKYSGKVSEPEIKLVFLMLAFLAFVAQYGGSEAVLPAYIIGMAMAGFFTQYKETLYKIRAIIFTAFTPFYFIKAGVLVSFHALVTMLGAILIYLLFKTLAKFLGVLPATKFFRYGKRNGIYTTLLMSTGLTFGTISSLYGLTHHYISTAQYSVLVATVILSAIVPTLIAQKFFYPVPDEEIDIISPIGEFKEVVEHVNP
ncbi:cation:proton antiporter [Candidatus Formimonas warabiya]|uniref:Sodium:proton exchanger n=1 Tax=Formimonas warabiya TaxID=1761012 RepID=A0A3G1KRW6_FORW1|nr:cation:proton antiporter [Candidatus Formimonas warabiya]ATW25233.1 sodium:proton exchanger [Candidatus Formimonas warabiya]